MKISPSFLQFGTGASSKPHSSEMGDIQHPLRPSSANLVVDGSTATVVDPSPAKCEDLPPSPTSKQRFKFSRIFNTSSRDREHATNGTGAGSSKKRRHRFSLLFTVFRIKRSTRGSVSGGNSSVRSGGDSDSKVAEKSASISDGREDLSRSSSGKEEEDSSCFSLHDEEEVCDKLRASFSAFSLHDEEEVCHEVRASFSAEEKLEMFRDIQGDEFESCIIRSSNHHSAGSEGVSHAPSSASLERLEIEEGIEEDGGHVAEDRDGCGRKEIISTVREGRVIRRELTLKELKLPHLSSLLAPALLSFAKNNKMARRISSAFTLKRHKAWRMTNLDVKKLLLDSLAARRRLIANNEGRAQLCDKKILMGKRCRALDFTGPLGDENSMQPKEWPDLPCDDKGMQVMELQPKAVARTELSVQVVAPPPPLPPHFVVGGSFHEE